MCRTSDSTTPGPGISWRSANSLTSTAASSASSGGSSRTSAIAAMREARSGSANPQSRGGIRAVISSSARCAAQRFHR